MYDLYLKLINGLYNTEHLKRADQFHTSDERLRRMRLPMSSKESQENIRMKDYRTCSN